MNKNVKIYFTFLILISVPMFIYSNLIYGEYENWGWGLFAITLMLTGLIIIKTWPRKSIAILSLFVFIIGNWWITQDFILWPIIRAIWRKNGFGP